MLNQSKVFIFLKAFTKIVVLYAYLQTKLKFVLFKSNIVMNLQNKGACYYVT